MTETEAAETEVAQVAETFWGAMACSKLPKFALELYGLLGSGQITGTNVSGLAKSAWDDGWGWLDAGMLVNLRDAKSKEEALLIVAMAWDAGNGASPRVRSSSPPWGRPELTFRTSSGTS